MSTTARLVLVLSVLASLPGARAAHADRPAPAKAYHPDRHRNAGKLAVAGLGAAVMAPFAAQHAVALSAGDVKTGILTLGAVGLAAGARQSYNFMKRTLHYNGK
jgi:hypothetical protein